MKPPSAESPIATIRQAARHLRLGERAIRAAIARGEIPLYQAPGAWPRVDLREVEAWLRSKRTRVSASGRELADDMLRRLKEGPSRETGEDEAA